MALLRLHGITKLAEVNFARMEGDGSISVLRTLVQESATEDVDKRRSPLRP